MSEKTSGLFGKLRGLVVEDVPDQTPEAQPEAPHQHAMPPVIQPAPGFAPPTSVSTIPESVERLQALDKSARDRLQAALTAATPPAFAKFAEMLSTLAETIPDEGARYKTALKLCAKERPADALLNDADVLIGAIEAASREFADTCKSQVDSKVGAKQAEIARLEADIAQAQNGIATLQASITKATSQRDALASGVVTEQQRIAQVQERFKGVYQIMHYELEVQKSKIVQFGKA